MSFTFNEDNQKKFEDLLLQYPEKKALTLPCLWMVQFQEGFISLEAMEYLAKKLELSPMDIYSVASFYTMFNLKPVGKYHIQLCKTLSCALNGSEHLREHLYEKLGIKSGETTKDGLFTISEVECLGYCEFAPCMSLNDEYIGDLTCEKIDNIIKGLKDDNKDNQ